MTKVATCLSVSPRTGRPKSDDPRIHVVSLRFTADEYELVKAAAGRFDVPAAAWARGRLLAAAKRALRD